MQMVSLEKEMRMEAKTAQELGLEYRNAMSRLAAAVHVVTTDGAAGRAGFAATAVCSVSDNPPTLLVCINRNSSAYNTVKANGVVCVNTLGAQHQELSSLFGGKTPVEQRFAAGRWHALQTGAPVLEDALVSFDCRIRTAHDGGTHDILICEVVDMVISDREQALMYFNRSYHVL
ncbi:NADH-dependent FMN reductase RutF [Rhizobium sp. RM]|uniref:NADH-dependent FMN reductase RutF n=1 Tax=Rhizobium/Agrobacterium group TaxID=227290 RepID=UPI00110DB1B9|nr:pyrimidine utilization flavin reductase protein F [Rhizobium sp. RM]NWJ27043.1 pyrimidine utilization flavin reductase protein F [Rhizobium sp. RM]TMV22900.1 pyrimidine utilization flavin reductase protein F [Rhizobium sp. Td3]